MFLVAAGCNPDNIRFR